MIMAFFFYTFARRTGVAERSLSYFVRYSIIFLCLVLERLGLLENQINRLLDTLWGAS